MSDKSDLELEVIIPEETRKEINWNSFLEYYHSIDKKCDMILSLIINKKSNQ